MTFEDYCDKLSDSQKIRATESILLTFTNSKDEVHSISYHAIEDFLIYVLGHYSEIESIWDNVPSRKEKLLQYEEKSYRAIYKSAKDEDLKTLASMGGSQTKPLTLLIGKLITFLAREQYTSAEQNTFFDPKYISVALQNWHTITDSKADSSQVVPPTSQSAAAKSFLLLAGISGTGKTRFVRKRH